MEVNYNSQTGQISWKFAKPQLASEQRRNFNSNVQNRGRGQFHQQNNREEVQLQHANNSSRVTKKKLRNAKRRANYRQRLKSTKVEKNETQSTVEKKTINDKTDKNAQVDTNLNRKPVQDPTGHPKDRWKFWKFGRTYG